VYWKKNMSLFIEMGAVRRTMQPRALNHKVEGRPLPIFLNSIVDVKLQTKITKGPETKSPFCNNWHCTAFTKSQHQQELLGASCYSHPTQK